MSEWKTSKLSEVIEIIGGGTPKRSKPEYWNGDIPWLSVADFNNDLRYVSSSLETITELGLRKSSTKLLKEGQLIISARGTVGCLAQLSVPMVFNQSCYGLCGKDGVIDNGFLYYALKNKISELKQKTHGAVFDTITRDTFEHINISYPTIAEQREIAKRLGDLDDKILLNTQTNQTLEQIAQTIYKSWFVDYEPTRAKAAVLAAGGSMADAENAAMCAISGKSAAELAALAQNHPTRYQQLADLAAAFPSALVPADDFGEIPAGWEISTIGESVETVGGATPSTKEESFWLNGDIHWTTPKDLSNLTDNILIDTNKKITAQGLKKISSGLLPINTVLMSSRAPVGYLALTKIPVAINQGYIAIKPSEKLSCYYMVQWCHSNMEEIKGRAIGPTVAEISKTNFRGMKIVVPPKFVLAAYNNIIEPIYDRITSNNYESKQLANTRDLLLPKLLSNEIL